MILWETCRQEFEPDGALRDIYVLDTNIVHWKLLFDMLRTAYSLEYSVDGESCPIPPTVEEVFCTRANASPSLHFRVTGVVVACHFFCAEQIELDVDPREVTSAVAFNGLIDLLQLIGDTVSRRVILTYENDEQNPFISYEPTTRQFEYRKIAA